MTPHSGLCALWRSGLYLIFSRLDVQRSEHSINVGRLLHECKFHLQTEANENVTPLLCWEITDRAGCLLPEAEPVPN